MLPSVDFARVGGRIQRTWRPVDLNPHQVAYGQSRAGKDHLFRYGVLPLKPGARAIVFDVKQGGGDQTWYRWGDDIALGDWRPDLARQRTRVLVPLGEAGEQLVRRALEALAVIGEHIIVLPDAGRIVESARRGGFGCEGLVTRIMSECASIGITVLAGLGAPAYAGGGLRSQAGRIWIGHTMHAETRTAFADAAGLPKLARGDLDTLPPRKFIYADYFDGAPMLAITQAPAGRHAVTP